MCLDGSLGLGLVPERIKVTVDGEVTAAWKSLSPASHVDYEGIERRKAPIPASVVKSLHEGVDEARVTTRV
jgi:hypothetical protein